LAVKRSKYRIGIHGRSSTMSATLKELFSRALDCASAAERDRCLTEACGGDAALRAEVEALLRAHAKADGFLGQPALDAALPEANPAGSSGDTQAEWAGSERELSLDFLAPSTKPGSLGRLDHYEVCELIGRGGMGVVLKAFDEKLHRVSSKQRTSVGPMSFSRAMLSSWR
jgi:hypothetical protein